MAVATESLALVLKNTAGFSTLYTCPAGHRTIVKQIVVSASATVPAGEEFLLAITRAGVGDLQIWRQQYGPSGVGVDAKRLELWAVLHEGDQLRVFKTSATGFYVVGAFGSELVL